MPLLRATNHKARRRRARVSATHFAWVNVIPTGGLPQSLSAAQAAIHLPVVQEMLRRLSEYKLGIFMPHMHGEQTGEFEPLPDEVAQVESGLQVSFRPAEEIASQPDHFLPVGWLWRGGASTPVAVCEMVSEEGEGNTKRYEKHKMPVEDLTANG